MTDRPAPLPIAELADLASAEAAGAFVDGQLDGPIARGVEARMAGDAELQARVESYRRQKAAIRALFNGALEEPTPIHLLLPRPRKPQWTWRMAAAVAGLLIGSAAGGGISWQTLQPEVPLLAAESEGFVMRAASAHAVNATEAIFSGRLGNDDPQALAYWLAQRLGVPLQPPNLEGADFKLVGGRLLPDAANAAAQFIYQRADGVRLTLYVRATRLGVVEPGFKWQTVNGLRICFWFTDSASFAMAADLTQAEMKALAQMVRSQGAS
jgi:anti-sigma factor RsiW